MRRPQPPLNLSGVESFGANGIRCLLIITSRTARGIPTTFRLLAKACGVNTNAIQGILKTLEKRGLIEWDWDTGGTLRPTGLLSLEFVPGVPRCLEKAVSDRANRAAANAHTDGSPSTADGANSKAA